MSVSSTDTMRRSTMRRSAGFTMTELITIIIILGILAAVAVPRFSTSEYRQLEFRDKTVAALRYAQKTATSHRRLVCVGFTLSSVALTIDHDKSGACNGQTLPLPGSSANTVQSSDATNAVFSALPADLYFQPDGRGTSDSAGATPVSLSLTVTGMTPINIAGTTGHVQ